MGTEYYGCSPVVRTRSVTPMAMELCRLPSLSGRSRAQSGRSMKLSRSIGNMKDIANPDTYYNFARKSIYSRYTPNEWHASNSANYELSERERKNTEQLRADAFRTVRVTDHATKSRQTDVSKRLDERVGDMLTWRQEIIQESRAMEMEISALQDSLKALEKINEHARKPLHIAEECLLHREKRVGIDLVNDDVEKLLAKEVATVQKAMEHMKKLIETTVGHLKVCRITLYDLEKDIRDKNHAITIDDRLRSMKNSSFGLSYHPGIETVENTLTNPDSWIRFSKNNIDKSHKCRSMSERLRADIDSTLRQAANDMWSRFNASNNALTTRVQEMTNARDKLQTHQQKVAKEIMETEHTVELLRKSILEKDAPLRMAQTRLDERTRRQNAELCNDDPMITLQVEVQEIRNSIKILKDRLRNSQQQLGRLNNLIGVLKSDIAVKENSIKIDQKLCLGMRKTFPMDPAISPIMQMPLG